jgi:hypothetical protein
MLKDWYMEIVIALLVVIAYMLAADNQAERKKIFDNAGKIACVVIVIAWVANVFPTVVGTVGALLSMVYQNDALMHWLNHDFFALSVVLSIFALIMYGVAKIIIALHRGWLLLSGARKERGPR